MERPMDRGIETFQMVVGWTFTRRTRISIQAFKSMQSTNGNSGSGWIELILAEARDLTAADLRGTSDPYVRVQYRNIKKKQSSAQEYFNDPMIT
ncbi:hypothetical protein GIB67_026447 [Kingdonia uniflora]|uniref:C2 domain-containing protein n=1 Tax=Kingdonia uniflora TaxID=39325 RepID=A0A7J7P683_9MAGN|nr:hypothetical protein GIB67_026447 [Kingdonia uniflora]